MFIVRREQLQDIPVIRELNRQVFGQEQEGSVVDKLRENCSSILSLVAVSGSAIVGHILFSLAFIEG